MRIVVLDTDVLIDNVYGFARWIDDIVLLKQEYKLVIPTIVVSEYFTAQEVEEKEGWGKAERHLSLFDKQDLTEEIAYELAKILRRKTYVPGAGLGDLIIAATAIHLDAELATRNKKDFTKIPNLRFFDPKELKLRG